MGLRTYVLLMALGTFLAWMAWGVIVMNVNPQEAGFIGFFMFYLTLAVALAGTLALLGTFFRIIVLKRHEVPSREIRIAFRHAVVFAGVAIASLLLSANGLLRTWHVVALVAVASIVEYLFLQAQQGRG
ncbi:MAG TPA: hypothetical protein VN397_04410 [Candidatus Methylomirabilis sp.]|nr:hypothetical protein [Candidatus Methylomirabilis sp.]